jgi:hypothetical protein
MYDWFGIERISRIPLSELSVFQVSGISVFSFVADRLNRFTVATQGWAAAFANASAIVFSSRATTCCPRRTAQPITPGTRTANNRNTARKDNEYFSFDWRLTRPIKFGERISLLPMFEMFNTFNNKNNVNPLTTPGLFNFDGFLRVGVGDPRSVQLALKPAF